VHELQAGEGGAAPGRGAASEQAGSIRFRGVSQAFGQTRVIESLSLDIAAGEFFSLLGPSGSGKTTCLRLVAGFDRPTSGSILLGGKDVTNLPPYARDVNTVFQDYALFPHLSVRQNVEYGLRMKGVEAGARAARALEALGMVELAELGDRAPSQISGGQRQRVALARALVNRPSVLLLDEPLGALDLRLREQMQVELKRLHRQLGITFVYVTHDQGEAMSMSDRIAVLVNGRVDQVASPRTLYCSPATAFVAEFVGASNVLRGPIAAAVGASAPMASIRPEHISVRAAQADVPGGHVGLQGVLTDVQFHGATSRYKVAVDGIILTAAAGDGEEAAPLPPQIGANVRITWAASRMVPLSS
jgi:putative spermidine/putrescine transport system ATP-binding protein